MGFEVTESKLLMLAPYANKGIIGNIIKHQHIIKEYNIVNHRLQMFMAQIAHESDGFRTTKEYASGKEYEGRLDLGNYDYGDGVKYKGRGLIQLTGRGNYESFARILGNDIDKFPEKVEEFPLALTVSCLFWKTHWLNDIADKGDFDKITRKINGGLNGQEQRLVYLDRAVDAFPIN